MIDISYHAKIRLYVPNELILTKKIELNKKQSHYLMNVMRKKIHGTFLVFNHTNGEFLAKIQSNNKKLISVDVIKKIRDPEEQTDLWVLFALVKKTPSEYIIQKATELGASKIVPLITERTVTKSLNLKRFQDIAIEASEQCERITIPEILPLQKLYDVIDDWVEKRTIYYGDETIRHDKHSLDNFKKSNNVSCGAVLVGPEGGFTINEIVKANENGFESISLGKNILKCLTANILAIGFLSLLKS